MWSWFSPFYSEQSEDFILTTGTKWVKNKKKKTNIDRRDRKKAACHKQEKNKAEKKRPGLSEPSGSDWRSEHSFHSRALRLSVLWLSLAQRRGSEPLAVTEATMFAAIEKRAVNPPWAALFLLLLLPPFFFTRCLTHFYGTASRQ